MTREEAIVLFEKQLTAAQVVLDSGFGSNPGENNSLYRRRKEMAEIALTALRPVSREQVEKVWPGCDFCNTADFGEFGFEITKHYAKICCALGSWRFPEKEQFLFCPKCGKPLTDEAVDMMLERWKEAVDGEMSNL